MSPKFAKVHHVALKLDYHYMPIQTVYLQEISQCSIHHNKENDYTH